MFLDFINKFIGFKNHNFESKYLTALEEKLTSVSEKFIKHDRENLETIKQDVKIIKQNIRIIRDLTPLAMLGQGLFFNQLFEDSLMLKIKSVCANKGIYSKRKFYGLGDMIQYFKTITENKYPKVYFSLYKYKKLRNDFSHYILKPKKYSKSFKEHYKLITNDKYVKNKIGPMTKAGSKCLDILNKLL
jgi:hypothetical protein